MGRITLVLVAIAVLIIPGIDSAKCRGRYYEMRGGDGFVAQRGCRGLDSQISEDYWTTIGYDGLLRDGRTTDDFLQFPEEENDGHTLRNSFVGYWITRSKYGDSRHYEAFGHGFIKPDGRVCGWFVGMDKEIVEVCGGFRVLSRSRRNPQEPIPFMWVQGPQNRSRDVLGFHHHKIAKYQLNTDEVFFGDADVKGKKFNGVSPFSETFVQVDSQDAFNRKIWLLKKKTASPMDNLKPLNQSPIYRHHKDLDVYNDPHHETRFQSFRLPPNYEKFGSPYQLFLKKTQQEPPVEDRRSQISAHVRASPQFTYRQDHPRYEEWLRNEYRIRGLVPRKREGENIKTQGSTDSFENKNSSNDTEENVLYPKNDSLKQIEFNGNDINVSQEHSSNGAKHVRLMRYRPQTVIIDTLGNTYTKTLDNGKTIIYKNPTNPEETGRIKFSDIDPKIEQILESRRREEEIRHHEDQPVEKLIAE
ncbi:unnamed protein product [Caenorhabditis sp. 36 PRJEB53466]|nr:unnamed protein product [Caenorhabditis sp. 36 PRJEB53466]